MKWSDEVVKLIKTSYLVFCFNMPAKDHGLKMTELQEVLLKSRESKERAM